MSGTGKDQITQDGAVELDEDELGGVDGGVKFDSPDRTSWKVNGLDGKGNDVITDEADKTGWKVTVDNISIGNVRK